MAEQQTVYVVDDEPAVRKAVRLILQAAGHNVETFASPLEFLDKFDADRPGCIVSDVRMPGMDGMELLDRLAERRARTPIIMLTAHGDIPMAVDAIKLGAVEFLEKPAEAETLREKVAAALAKDAASRLAGEEHEEIQHFLETLTTREREVLRYLVDGKHAKTIAKILGTSHNTVRVQRSAIMKKMRADTVADLVRMMSAIGLLDEKQ